jgi:hypothetical protein
MLNTLPTGFNDGLDTCPDRKQLRRMTATFIVFTLRSSSPDDDMTHRSDHHPDQMMMVRKYIRVRLLTFAIGARGGVNTTSSAATSWSRTWLRKTLQDRRPHLRNGHPVKISPFSASPNNQGGCRVPLEPDTSSACRVHGTSPSSKRETDGRSAVVCTARPGLGRLGAPDGLEHSRKQTRATHAAGVRNESAVIVVAVLYRTATGPSVVVSLQ